jgi:hypothetical protein
MDPSASVAAAGPSSGGKRRGRPPGSGIKVKILARWTPGAGGPLRIGAPRQDEASRAALGTSSAMTLVCWDYRGGFLVVSTGINTIETIS